MIGNDVIDLDLAWSESDWRRKGYLEKLFGANERELILSSADPGISVWDLWSRKEAAYKIFNRRTGIRAFNPLYFECRDLASESRVNCGNEVVFTQTEVSGMLIHTVAVESLCDFERVSLREYAEIVKVGALPFYRENRELRPATVSHHGKFARCLSLKSDGLDVDPARKRAVHGTFFSDFQ